MVHSHQPLTCCSQLLVVCLDLTVQYSTVQYVPCLALPNRRTDLIDCSTASNTPTAAVCLLAVVEVVVVAVAVALLVAVTAPAMSGWRLQLMRWDEMRWGGEVISTITIAITEQQLCNIRAEIPSHALLYSPLLYSNYSLLSAGRAIQVRACAFSSSSLPSSSDITVWSCQSNYRVNTQSQSRFMITIHDHHACMHVILFASTEAPLTRAPDKHGGQRVERVWSETSPPPFIRFHHHHLIGFATRKKEKKTSNRNVYREIYKLEILDIRY
jgi:hypothetical protein